MPNLFEIQMTVDLMQTLACITVVIHTLEIIAERKEYGVHGIHHYAILKKSSPWMIQGWRAFLLHQIYEFPCYLFLIILELASALLIISHLFQSLSGYFIFIIFLVHLLSYMRNQYGTDGADQMQSILFTTLLLFYLSSSPFVKLCCIFFICLQTLLSYFTAGIVKMRSSIWRSGKALENIVQTTRFCNETFAQILMKRPHLSKLLCWSVLLFECMFPLLTFLGTPACLIFLGAGILFHFSIALVMGLNSFFWSFIATYPAILLFATTFHSLFFSPGK